MLLSDPEMESSILISSDEGATYQKYRLTFYIQSLLFHPKQEDWVLAYSLDQKVNKILVFIHILSPNYHLIKAPVYSIQILEGIQWHFIMPNKLLLSEATKFPFYSLVSKYVGRYISIMGNALYYFTGLGWPSLLFYPFDPYKNLCETSRKCVFTIIL